MSSSIENEFICTQISKELGFKVPDIEIITAESGAKQEWVLDCKMTHNFKKLTTTLARITTGKGNFHPKEVN